MLTEDFDYSFSASRFSFDNINHVSTPLVNFRIKFAEVFNSEFPVKSIVYPSGLGWMQNMTIQGVIVKSGV